jgi:crotonobetainyl-CoA:carnitine CoA-transferase CaiB-like acyl-CoA transferase
MSGGPLQGIRVLDLTSVVVGPVATQFFADYGADVVKIEPPEGDLLRTLGGKSVTPKMASKFLHMNRNKRSVVLDLKQPAARGALKRLCAGADVLVVNMRAAALKRLGLCYDELRAVNGKLITCSLVGFGQFGRYAAKPAYDTIIQGSAGVAACHARSTGTPRYTPMVMADHIVGLIAVQMVLLALYHRKSSGTGQHIEVPMFENMAAFVMSEHMYLRTFDPPLGGTGDPRVLDPEARPLPTADGFICVSANTDKQAFAFFDAVGRPELKADRRFDSVAARFANVRDYFEVRAQSLRPKTTVEWLELLERADVPCMPYHTFESLLDDPHLREVGMFERVAHPTEGTIWNIALPNRLASGARSDYLPAPKLGQHTREVLSEAGLSGKEIEDLAAGSPPAGKISREAG